MGCPHWNENISYESRVCTGYYWDEATETESECEWEGNVDVTYCGCLDGGQWTCPRCGTEHEGE